MHQTSSDNDALVRQYRPLVRRIARRMRRRLGHHRVELEDLEQAGMLGLLDAAPKFNALSGASFETYAGYRIRGAMVDSLRDGDWAPRSVPRAARDLAQAIHTVEVTTQRPARESEIADLLGLSLAEYRRTLLDVSTHHVFSSEEHEEQTHSVTEGLTSRPPQPDESLASEGFHSAVHKALAELPERERYIFESTFFGGRTLRGVGDELGITESRACQLRTQAVARLRTKLGDWK